MILKAIDTGVKSQEETNTVADLIEQLRSSERTKRLSAACQLAALEGNAKEAISILRTWIGSEGRYSHVTAIGAIIWIDNSEVDELLPSLIDATASGDELVQLQAVLQIGSLGQLALPAVNSLEKLLDQDSTSSTISSDALHEITGDPDYVIDVRLRLLNEPEWLDNSSRAGPTPPTNATAMLAAHTGQSTYAASIQPSPSNSTGAVENARTSPMANINSAGPEPQGDSLNEYAESG